MANSDVIITRAGKFQRTLLDEKKQKALKVLGWAAAFNAQGIFPTKGDQHAYVASAQKAMAGIVDFDAVENAIIWQFATNLNAGFDVNTNTLLADSTVFQKLDPITMRKVELYLLGNALAVLT